MILNNSILKSTTCCIRSKFVQSQLLHCNNISCAAFSSQVTSANEVIIENYGDKGVITLNRPKALNALNLSMINQILPVLRKWEKEKLCVIVKATGGKSFCAGGDLKTLFQNGQEFARKEYTMNGVIGTYKIPYIALMDGIVMGGGVGLSVHGRYRIATERTLFAMPETQLGHFPDVGGSYLLPRLFGKLGVYLALTGRRLRGADALLAGIATHYVVSFKLNELEHSLLKCSTEQNIKDALAKFSAPVNQEFSLSPHLEKINECFSASSVEDIISNLETDGSEWAKDTVKLLQKMCPTSLKVTLKALILGSKMRLQDCLQMEYGLTVASLENTEFYEGIRALLIDKDGQPKWKPASLQEVSEELVNAYFKRIPENQNKLLI